MHIIDWIILLAYCAVILAVALYFRKRAGRNVEGFFGASRDLPWWVIGFADVAGYTGGGQGFIMMFFLSGFGGLWLMAWVSWVIWMPLVAVLWAPMWRRLGVLTSGEFIERRYGGRRAAAYRSVYAVYACGVWGVTSLAYVAAWMAATIAPVLGWTQGTVLLVFGAVTIGYSMLSGLFAVAYNDVIQFVLLMGGNTAFAWILIARAGGLEQVWHQVVALRSHDFLQPLPWGGQLTAASLIALAIQGLFFAGSPFAGEGWTAQRYMAARNELHAVLGQMFNGVLALVIRLVPFILIGLAAGAMYPVTSVDAPAALWGNLVRLHAPEGLFGLLLVSSIAGYMAAVSSIGNWAASYVVNDVYRNRVRPQASDRELVLVSRIASGVLLALAFSWGGAIDTKQLEKWVLFINSALIVFALPLAWLKWFWWRMNVAGDMVGVLGAFPAGYVVWFGSDAVLPSGFRAWLRGVEGWNLDGLVPAFSNLDRYPFWMGFAVLFGLGWVSILVATLATRPEPLEVLGSFYRAVRPAGWWGPVRRQMAIGGDVPREPPVRREMIACAAGVLFYFSLTVAFFALFGGRFGVAGSFAVISAAAGALFVREAIQSPAKQRAASVRPLVDK